MTPLEAWSIISASLTCYFAGRYDEVRLRPTEEEKQAEVICFKALQEMQEREEAEKDGKTESGHSPIQKGR